MFIITLPSGSLPWVSVPRRLLIWSRTIFIMMNKKSFSPPPTIWQLLVLAIGILLVVAVSIDIYIRLLLPEVTVDSNTRPKLNPNSPSRTQQSSQPESQHNETASIGSVFSKLEDLEDMGAAGDTAWESLFPKGGGYLYLRSSNSSTGSEQWGVSMFHSLHCLFMLRSGLQHASAKDHESMTRRLTLHISQNHMAHCLSYLAQVRPVDHLLSPNCFYLQPITPTRLLARYACLAYEYDLLMGTGPDRPFCVPLMEQ